MKLTKQFEEDLVEVVFEAGREIMKVYGGDFKVSQKEDHSPTTIADIRSNEIILEYLDNFDIPILSEESKDNLRRLESDRIFIVDSLDGTKDFIQKTDEFSIMVALIENESPSFGIVYEPALDKLYLASKGKGAFLYEKDLKKELRVSDEEEFGKMSLVVSRNHLGPEEIEVAKSLGISKMKKVGSNGVKIGKIAVGEAEMFFNFSDKMGEWDSAAPEIILKEAGGKITDIYGNNLKYNKRIPKNENGIVASNNQVHQKIIDAIKK